MGNTESLGPNQDKYQLHIRRDLLQNFKKHITVADHAVVSLANAIDAMSASCCLLKQEVKDTSEEDSKQEESYKVIVETISECISANKDVMIQSVKELFRFLFETCKCNTDVPDDLFKNLEMYVYNAEAESKLTESNLMLHFFQRRIKQLEKEMEEVREREKLQRQESENLSQRLSIWYESKLLEDVLETRRTDSSQEATVTKVQKTENTFQRQSYSRENLVTQQMFDDKRQSRLHCAETYDQFNNLLAFEDNYYPSEHEEEETSFCASPATSPDTDRRHSQPFRKKQPEFERAVSENLFVERFGNRHVRKETNTTVIAGTDDEKRQLREKIKQLETKNAELETEKREADEKIKSLCSRKIIVQVARSWYLPVSSKLAEKSLMRRLSTTFAAKDINLEIIYCSRYGEVSPVIPLLICCNKFDTKKSNVNATLVAEGYETSDKSALIIFHQTTETSLPNSIQNYKKYENPEVNIFHAGYLSDLYDSQYNTETVNNIIKFLLNKSETSGGVQIEENE